MGDGFEDKWWEEGCGFCWAMDQTASVEATKIRKTVCVRCKTALHQHDFRHPHARPGTSFDCEGFLPLNPPTKKELANVRRELETLLKRNSHA